MSPFLCYAELLPELFLPQSCVAAVLLVFVKHLLWLRKNSKNPAWKGPLGLLPGCFRQKRIHMLLNYSLLWLKRAARECLAHWLIVQLLKRLFTDFKHQLSLL